MMEIQEEQLNELEGIKKNNLLYGTETDVAHGASKLSIFTFVENAVLFYFLFLNLLLFSCSTIRGSSLYPLSSPDSGLSITSYAFLLLFSLSLGNNRTFDLFFSSLWTGKLNQ